MEETPQAAASSRSLVVSPDSVAAAQRVLQRYELHGPRIEPAHAGGFTNDNLSVSDENGGRFLLRRYRKQEDTRRVRLQLDYQHHVEALEVPVAPTVHTRDGRTVVTENGNPWVLCEWVEGSGYDFGQPAQAFEAGRVLALLHKAGESFESGSRQTPPDRRSVRRTFLDYVATAHAQKDLLISLFPEPDVADQVAYACSWWERFAWEWPVERLQALPRTWLHGDYHGMNTIFAGGRMTAVIDFDDIWFGPRICDIAQGFFNFGRRMRGISLATGRQMRADFGRLFLDGYQSLQTLSREEYEAIPDIAPNVLFPPDGIWLTEMRGAGLDIRARLQRDVAITRDIEAEMTRLAPEFGWGRT